MTKCKDCLTIGAPENFDEINCAPLCEECRRRGCDDGCEGPPENCPEMCGTFDEPPDEDE